MAKETRITLPNNSEIDVRQGNHITNMQITDLTIGLPIPTVLSGQNDSINGRAAYVTMGDVREQNLNLAINDDGHLTTGNLSGNGNITEWLGASLTINGNLSGNGNITETDYSNLTVNGNLTGHTNITTAGNSNLNINGGTAKGDTINLVGQSHMTVGPHNGLNFLAATTMDLTSQIEFTGPDLSSFSSIAYDVSTSDLKIFSGSGALAVDCHLSIPKGTIPFGVESGNHDGVFINAKLIG